MTQSFQLACVQNSAVAEVARNIDITLRLTREACDRGAQLVCLPEYFSGVELRGGLLHPAAFAEDRHPVLQAFADLARARRAWLLLGSLGVLADDGRIFNRAYLLNRGGAIAAPRPRRPSLQIHRRVRAMSPRGQFSRSRSSPRFFPLILQDHGQQEIHA